MKRFFAIISVVFIVIAVGCTKSTEITPTAKGILKEKPGLVPFEGRYAGTAMDGGAATCTLPFHRMCLSGMGWASHCGKSNLKMDYCVNTVVSSPPPHLTFTGEMVNGVAAITAANGDKLFSTFTGTYIIENVNGHWINTIIVNDGVITGGTGRFAGAEGNFTGGGTQDNGTGPLPNGTNVPSEIWFTGTIDY